MDRLLGYAGYVVAAASFWIAPGTTAAWTPFDNETTVYTLSCAGQPVDGVCRGEEKTGVPFTYKVSVDEQSVWYWSGDDPAMARRLPFCAVHDTKSWLCQWESADIPRSRFGMIAGKYAEIETCMTAAAHSDFYQVPPWRWWLVRLRENLS